jgi:uncharacterized protein
MLELNRILYYHSMLCRRGGIVLKWLAIILGTIFVIAAAAQADSGNPTLTIEGMGTATAPADTVRISVSVTSTNNNMTQAQAEVQEKMSKAIDALKAAGVKDDEIMPGQSSGVTSYQSTSKVCKVINNTTVCENNSYGASSLEKSAVVRMKTTDQSRIDSVVNAAKSAGANAYMAGYGLSDTSKAVTEARQKAVANAKENAQGMASAAGAHLGKVLDISEYGYPDVSMGTSAFSGQPGMVEVTSNVIVTYEIVS